MAVKESKCISAASWPGRQLPFSRSKRNSESETEQPRAGEARQLEPRLRDDTVNAIREQICIQTVERETQSLTHEPSDATCLSLLGRNLCSRLDRSDTEVPSRVNV